MGVGYGDAGEESTSSGVSVPVVGMMTPAVADYDQLPADGGRVRWTLFGDWSLEDKGARWEEFADGGGDGLAFSFGLAGIL